MAKRTMGWLVLVLAMAATTTVLAHMKLAKSMPAAGAVVAGKPAKVQIWFTQAPDRAVSKITVSGASGEVKLGGADGGCGQVDVGHRGRRDARRHLHRGLAGRR